MQGICLISFLFVPFIHPADQASPPAISKTEEVSHQEFIGSFDFDENNKLIFTHFPEGSHKPAVIYFHSVVFENRSSKYKAIKYLNRNVKVKGNIIRLGDEEFVFVNQIELMIIDL
jgi:hypothetical protein